MHPSLINLRDHLGRPLGQPLRVASAGGGARGMTYATLLDESDGQAVVGAAAEPREAILAAMGVRFSIPEGARFADWRDMLAAPRTCDAVIISLQDSDHLEAATALAAAGYEHSARKADGSARPSRHTRPRRHSPSNAPWVRRPR